MHCSTSRASGVCLLLLCVCALLTGCAAETPESKAVAHYRAAKEAADEDDYEKAVVEFSAGIHLHPTASGHLHRGFAWMMLAKFDFARVDFLKVRTLDPQNSMASANLALLELRENDLDSALTYASTAIEFSPKLAYGYTTRAQVYERQGLYGLALADYNTAVVLDPDNAVIFNNRGTLQSTLGNDIAAAADYSMAIKLDSHQAMALWNRGMVHQKQRDFERALRDYTEAALRDPDDYSSYVLRGALYEEMGKKEKAESDYREARRLNPNWAGPESATAPPAGSTPQEPPPRSLIPPPEPKGPQ